MTPQTARRLMIHEHEAALPDRRRLAVVDGFSPSRPRLVPDARPAPGALLRRESLRRRLLGATDLVAAALALLLVLTQAGNSNPLIATLGTAPLVVMLFKIGGLYDRDQMRLAHSTLDEAPALLQLNGLFALSVTIVISLLLQDSVSGAEIASLWLVSFLATTGGRMVARWIAAKAVPVERCVVIGDPRLADRIRGKLRSSRARAVVVATLPIEHDELDGLDHPEGFLRLISDLHADRLIVAPTTSDARGVAELIRAAKADGLRVSVLPRMFEVVGSSVEFDDVDGLTMLGVRPFGLSRSSRALKRAFDVVATSIGMLAVAPVMAIIAVAIRLDSKGPIFFRQVRVGRDGRHFRIVKFRTMVVGADKQKSALRERNEGGEGLFKLAHDPRITRVGSFLRRASLDEMPQLVNVLRGEMSLVGPRPLVTDEDALVHGLDRSRLYLTPGMTGPWQVLGSRVPMQEMVAIDYLYVANWSLWADLKLLLRTIRHVLRRGNV